MSEGKWVKVKCSSCGSLKPTNPKAYESRVKKFGSVEEMESKWLCKVCAKALKEKK